MIKVNIIKQQGDFFLDINFFSKSNGITVLAGASGSGKTSIINMIAGLVTPDTGRIEVGGVVLFDSEKKINIPVTERRCGYVFQDGRLFPNMNVKKNLLYGAKTEGDIKLDDVTELLGIKHLLDRMPSKLSGGEKQRVAIGRALLMNPKILLMDEPLASLDPARKDELMPYITKLPENFGIPVVYVTHSRREILKLSDVLVRLENGKVVSIGKPSGEFDGLGTIDAKPELINVIEGKVAGYNKKYGIVDLDYGNGILSVLGDDVETGTIIRTAFKASDVSISLNKPHDMSTRNVFYAKIESIVSDTERFVLVHLDIGVKITARISTASADRLVLWQKDNVYALIKSATILHT